MTTFEKIIKYVATAFAALLAVSIVMTILEFGFHGLSALTSSREKVHDTENSFKQSNVSSLSISNKVTDIVVVSENRSDVFVEAKNVFEGYKCSVNDKGVLKINNSGKKKMFLSFINGPEAKITIHMPKDIVLDKFVINGGVGDFDITGIDTKLLDIDGGVGDITLSYCQVNDGNLDGGVGDIKFTECVLLNADIDGGVGDITLNLNGNIDDYSFNTDNGVGTIRINDKKPGSYPKSGGKYTIKCDNGVGDIDITIE